MPSSSASFVSIFKIFLMMMRNMDAQVRNAILQVISLNHSQVCQTEGRQVIQMEDADKSDKHYNDAAEENTIRIRECQDNITKRKRADGIEELNRQIRRLLEPLEK